MAQLTHINDEGEASMVNVGPKHTSFRKAVVHGEVSVSNTCVESLTEELCREVISVARVAGTQAAKQTAMLIPHCHQIPLDSLRVQAHLDRKEHKFYLVVEASATGKTGVEMEAFTACHIAALSIYDMLKAIDPEAVMGPFALVEKTGGKHGHWKRSGSTC